MEIANPYSGPRDIARDLQTNSRARSPLSYAYWHLHLRPILLRFPRGTRARNSFSRSAIEFSGFIVACIGVNLSSRSAAAAALENEKSRPRGITNHAESNSRRRRCNSSESARARAGPLAIAAAGLVGAVVVKSKQHGARNLESNDRATAFISAILFGSTVAHFSPDPSGSDLRARGRNSIK